MISSRDRAYCSHSYGNGGECIANCYRLLTIEDAKRADELGLPITFADFKNSHQCALLNEDEQD